jgi:uncharacterized protein with PQ loop repeat
MGAVGRQRVVSPADARAPWPAHGAHPQCYVQMIPSHRELDVGTRTRGATMPPEVVVDAANVLQSSIPLLSLSAYFPQWRKIVLTKSSRDISLRAWVVWTLTASFSCFYSIVQYLLNGRGVALIFSTSTSCGFIVITVYLIIKYRHGNSAVAQQPHGARRDR